MARSLHILSVGYDRFLMRVRSLVLRSSGYSVEEVYSGEQAVLRAESDTIDLLLICHTIPERDQKKLIAAVQRRRRLLPILCINNREFTFPLSGCVGVENTPVELLEGVQAAVLVTRRGLLKRLGA